jgi:hypothetical protein
MKESGMDCFSSRPHREAGKPGPQDETLCDAPASRAVTLATLLRFQPHEHHVESSLLEEKYIGMLMRVLP